jgi:large subunit ribosomal protein L31
LLDLRASSSTVVQTIGILTMAKSGIHPEWHPEAKVFCDGEQIMTVGSTQSELHVDIWSGNHPFYTGTQKIIDTEGRVERFMRKYGMGGSSDGTSSKKKKA